MKEAPDDIVKEITEKVDNLEKALRDNQPAEQLKQLMEDVITAMGKAVLICTKVVASSSLEVMAVMTLPIKVLKEKYTNEGLL